MIQIYSATNTNYTNNGDRVLHPIECLGDFILNGSWVVEMRTPLDGTQDLLEPDAVIKATGPQGTDQLYRIYAAEKDMDGVTSYATPIFMQAAHDVFLMDTRCVNMTGQQALDHLMDGTAYTGESDITATNSAYYVRKNLIEALMSNEAPSFLNRWGGEVYFDNRKIYINQRIGADNGYKAKLGHNMTGCSVKINYSNVVTRIVPIAYNGYLMAAPYYVDSPRIANYPFVRTKLMEFPDIKLTQDAYSTDTETYDTIAELQTALAAAAAAEFNKGIDLPEITYTVDIADLSHAVGFEDISDLLALHLGDTVHVENTTLGIQTSARCIELVWDFILQRPAEVKLGDFSDDYFSRLTKQRFTLDKVLDTSTQTVNGETISGIINAMQAQLRLQNTAAERSDVRAILFEDLDPESPLFGAMSLGTQGFQISNERTADGQDWVWSTFGTAQGFSANLIIAGVLYSQNYQEGVQGFKIDLNTGTIEAPALEIQLRNSIQVGARNMLFDTNQSELTAVAAPSNRAFLAIGTNVFTRALAAIEDPPQSNIDYGLTASCSTATDDSGIGLAFYSASAGAQSAMTVLEEGQTYVLSCYARKIAGTEADVFLRYDAGRTGYTEIQTTTLTDSDWHRLAYVYTYHQSDLDPDYMERIGARVSFGITGDNVASAEICGFQLEQGTIPTSYQENTTDLKSYTEAQITATAEMIQTNVATLDAQINGESGINAALSQIRTTMEGISESLGNTQADLQNAYTSITQTNDRIDVLAGDLAGFTAYMHFDSNNYLVIGDTGSAFNAQMTPEAFNILYNQEPVASFSSTGLLTQTVKIAAPDGGDAELVFEMAPIKIVPNGSLGWLFQKA